MKREIKQLFYDNLLLNNPTSEQYYNTINHITTWKIKLRYRTPECNDIVIRLDGDTIWLDAHLIAELFGVNRPAVVKHIGHIYESLDLEKSATCSILEQVIRCFKYIFDSNELKPNSTISKIEIVQKEG